MIKFAIGTKYYTRSVCDHNCIFRIEVLKRTAKTLTVETGHRETKTLRIFTDYHGNEAVKPFGSYSTAPIIDATDSKQLLPDWATTADSSDA